MRVFKFLSILFGITILCGCGKTNSNNVVQNFEKQLNGTKSYSLSGTMSISSNEDTYDYNVNVDYKYDDYYKVKLVNKNNDHEQVILKNENAVYVVTPSLNKSFKFQSEWPDNSSQTYLLKSLLKDIKDTENSKVEENDDYYIVTADVNYPNNSSLKNEKLYFDKKNNLKKVEVLNEDGTVVIMMEFKEIKYSVKFDDKNFELESLISTEEIESENSKETENKEENTENNAETNDSTQEETKETSILDDIVYPLYLPADTALSSKDTVEVDGGERVILTFTGSKPFMIIEEKVATAEDMVVTSIYGEPLMLSSAVGALSSNSLEWSNNNINYYISSSYLTSEEMLSIAESLNTASVVEVVNSK